MHHRNPALGAATRRLRPSHTRHDVGRIWQDLNHENQLFYLMSRGLGRKEAEGLIVESKMTTTFDQIPDIDLRNDLKREVHERILDR